MITSDYPKFFNGLEKNNNKEWFHDHKAEYEAAKKQFIALIESVLPTLREWEPKIDPDPKKALFRINKDIRFSKDKTPYHTILKAGFSAEGKKSLYPGFYLGLSAEKVHMGGGIFNVSPETLKSVRELILEKPQALSDILNAKVFREHFGELKGDIAKRTDKAFMEAANETPWIMHKQFYAMHEEPLNPHLNSNQLPETILNRFQVIQPLVQYLTQAF